MRNTLISKIYELAKIDSNIILLTGDLGYGVLDKFVADLPNQFINCGIAEQNMLSVAAGLSVTGKTVFVYSIGNFPTLRAIEQIRNDCCYHNANVKIISVGGGMSYGALGMSHHATEDIAIMRALPGVRIYSPSCAGEVNYLWDDIMKPGVVYIRLGKGNERDIYEGREVIPYQVKRGQDVVILGTGAILEEAVQAEKILAQQHFNIGIISLPILKPLNSYKLIEALKGYSKIITLEEHNINGGLFGAIAEFVAMNRLDIVVAPIALKDLYPSIVGDQKFLRKFYHIDSAAIIDEALKA